MFNALFTRSEKRSENEMLLNFVTKKENVFLPFYTLKILLGAFVLSDLVTFQNEHSTVDRGTES